MKLTLLFIAAVAPAIVNNYESSLPLWERLLEKWGIGFIGLGLFCGLAWWTYRREEKAQEKRDRLEEEFRKDRADLAKENNDLTRQMLKQAYEHSTTLEELIREGLKAEKATRDGLDNLVSAIKDQR